MVKSRLGSVQHHTKEIAMLRIICMIIGAAAMTLFATVGAAQTVVYEVSQLHQRVLEATSEVAETLSSESGKHIASAFQRLLSAGTDISARDAALAEIAKAWSGLSAAEKQKLALKDNFFGESTPSLMALTKKDGESCCGCLFSSCCGPKSCECSWGSCKSSLQGPVRVAPGGPAILVK
jgi:hypothetical protein